MTVYERGEKDGWRREKNGWQREGMDRNRKGEEKNGWWWRWIRIGMDDKERDKRGIDERNVDDIDDRKMMIKGKIC